MVAFLAQTGCSANDQENPNVTRENAKRIRQMRSLAEVEALLGPGEELSGRGIPAQYRTATDPAGRPLAWRRWVRKKGADIITVGFTDRGVPVVAQHSNFGP